MSRPRSKRAKMFRKAMKDGSSTYPTIVKESALGKVDIPKTEKVVSKVVPAKADGEVIGKAVVYEDGTIDIIANKDISEKAKAHIYSFQQTMLGLDGEEINGVPE